MIFHIKGTSLLMGRLKFVKYGKLYIKNAIIRDYCCDKGKKADLAIIGAGPAGMYGALRAKRNGIKHVVLIDKYPNIGGNCVHYGCIPSKALIAFAHSYHQVKSGLLALQGVITPDVKLDLDQMMKTKSKVIKDYSDYLKSAFKSQDIQIVRGKARICCCNQLAIDGNDGIRSFIEAEKILIATGSEARPFPGIQIDEKQIISSNGAIKLMEVPKHMVIGGAGIIAIEMGFLWSRLGSKVTIISNDSTIIGSKMDSEIKAKYKKILEGQGLRFVLNTKVVGAKKCGKSVRVKTANNDGCNEDEQECDVLLLAIGQIPYTEGLNLEGVGIQTNKGGYIPVQQNYETCCPGVYAVGDATPGPMTAHKAMEDGILAIDGMCGKGASMDYNHIPMILYTYPEAASVGKTEDELKKECHPYRVVWADFQMCARGRTNLDTTGCIKGLICKNTDRILGTHIIGEQAGEIINEMAVAQQFGLTAENLSRVVHGHPTYAKMLKTVFSN